VRLLALWPLLTYWQMGCRLAGETEVLGENLPQRHFCPSQNPTWLDPGLNPGRHGGTPVTNRLSYGAAMKCTVRSEVLTAVNIMNLWDKSTYSLIKRYQHFRGKLLPPSCVSLILKTEAAEFRTFLQEYMVSHPRIFKCIIFIIHWLVPHHTRIHRMRITYLILPT
jgi:hypothetical protein